MSFTTVSPVLNAASIVAVWMSEMSTTAKIILTVLLVVKCVLFYYSAWMPESERFRRIGVSLCIIANVALITYSFLVAAYHVVVTVAVTLIVLLIWSFATVYDFIFLKREGK